MKKLIVYYSLDGSVKFISEIIAQQTGADVLRLKPIKDLKSDSAAKYFWAGKQVLMKEKPALEEFAKNPNDYDLIFIGTPVWAWTYVPAFNTFFEKIKLQNKKIVLFCCHGGQPAKTLANLKTKLQGNEIIGEIQFQEPIKDQENSRQKCLQWLKEMENKIL